MEEDDTIQPADDKLGSLEEPPLMSGNIPFDEIGITPPPKDKFMEVCNVTFDPLKKRIMHKRQR